MRFSSIFLIATAVSAIGSSPIPSPDPLRVNSLDSERDVDIYRRQPLLNMVAHHNDHYITARLLAQASTANREAAKHIRRVADAMPEDRKSGWLRQSAIHTELANGYASMCHKHVGAILEQPLLTELHSEVHSDRNQARIGINYALSVSRDVAEAMSS